MTSVVSQYIFINSADREYGETNDFTVNLVDIRDDFESMSLSIQNLTMPRSYYPINSLNNVISLGLTSAVLSQGNYTPSTLITEFISKSPIPITGSYNSTTGKFSFMTVDNSAWQIDGPYKYLGLSSGIHSSSSGIIVSDIVANLSGPREIRILTNIPIYSTNTTNVNRNVLISIYPNCQFGEMINYTIQNFAHIKLNTAHVGQTRFQIVDEDYNPINLNGEEYSLTLILTSNSLQD